MRAFILFSLAAGLALAQADLPAAEAAKGQRIGVHQTCHLRCRAVRAVAVRNVVKAGTTASARAVFISRSENVAAFVREDLIDPRRTPAVIGVLHYQTLVDLIPEMLQRILREVRDVCPIGIVLLLDMIDVLYRAGVAPRLP